MLRHELSIPSEEQIFEQAQALPDPAARQAYLDSACGGRPDLRQKVEELLRSDREAEEIQFFAGANRTTRAEDLLLEKPGTRIGRYKLLEQIGEGGFGTVYVAEQREPVKRRVALKIIKLGMDTRQVVARFEAERQALAMIDHPNIAKVLDAGATDNGRPYFVMELVKGVPITHYCDEQQLPLLERLNLFISVCHAI
jgi:eukaryotic-like serine/threonine-protein kinase